MFVNVCWLIYYSFMYKAVGQVLDGGKNRVKSG